MSTPLSSLASRAEAGWLFDTHSWLAHHQKLKLGWRPSAWGND